MSNLFENALKTLEKLSLEAKVSNEVLEYLSNPEKVFIINFPVKMDDGSVKIFNGYRTRYNTILGPAKGGTRFHENVDINTINALACWMTIKTALVGLPYGGGKGGVKVNPSTLSTSELERLSRAYMQGIAHNVGPTIDVPACDIGTNSKTMAWMLDEYEKIHNVKAPALITGKPVALGGSLFRTEATGYGVYLICDFVTNKINKSPKEIKVAIQGLGNVGFFAAKFLHEAGYKVVAVSDYTGAIYNKDGLDINVLLQNISNNKSATLKDSNLLENIGNIQKISNEELLILDVDFLIPGAIDGVINASNMEKIKAPYIIEAANGGLSSEAINYLDNKGVVTLPDVLSNSGGVIVSYFEWVQNMQCYSWSIEHVKNELTKVMKEAFDKIWLLTEKEKINPRSAAYSIALKRIEESLMMKR